MAIAVKDIGTIAAKWSQRAQAAGPDYTAGVKAPKTDWATATAGSAQSWSQGVQQAVTDGRFASGVTKAGTAKWQSGAVNKGATRYPQGVSQGQSAYQAGEGPMLQVIAALNLPPRQARGSPANLQRVAAVDTALHQAKVGS